MPNKEIPIYDIKNFNCNNHKADLYINTFRKHLQANSFTETPHSHKFYLLAFFTKGNGVHKIDFDTYSISKGLVFFIQPGQIHSWQLSEDIDGYIIFCSPEIYNLYFNKKRIENYVFYNSPSNKPELQLNNTDIVYFSKFFELMLSIDQNIKLRKDELLLNLIDIIHIEAEQRYIQNSLHIVHSYNHKMEQFYKILNKNFYTEKSPSFYAEKLNITLKHLNRICKTV